MIDLQQVDDLNQIRAMKEAYLHSLIFPIDAYWKSAVIGQAPHWRIMVDGQLAGYFAVRAGKRLLQFHVNEQFQPAASEIFTFLVRGDLVQSAAAGTFEPHYLSHCLDHQIGVRVRSYLFQDHKMVEPVLNSFPAAQFRPASAGDAGPLAIFYGHNDEFQDPQAIAEGFGNHLNYARALIEREQVFILVNKAELLGSTNYEIIGVGECRFSTSQSPYADLGMITASKHRRQGIGAYILARLKEHCYRHGAEPICSCAAENISSRKTIEKAGFITRHRLLNIQFSA